MSRGQPVPAKWRCESAPRLVGDHARPDQELAASLRTAVDIMLASGFASFVWWGGDLVQLYNDAALAIVQAKHPAMLGGGARHSWADVWDEIGSLVEQVSSDGKTILRDNLPLTPDCEARAETAWFTFCYSPLRDESGHVHGLFITAMETTGQVMAPAPGAQYAGRHPRNRATDRLDEPERGGICPPPRGPRRCLCADSGRGDAQSD